MAGNAKAKTPAKGKGGQAAKAAGKRKPSSEIAKVIAARPVGRPPSYHPKLADLAHKLCKLGATDVEIADALEVDTPTLYRWKATHPEFCNALKLGKEAADERVVRSLYAKATGYSYDAVKILQHEGAPVIVPYREHVPPSDTAAIFWLKNRRPQEWRDKVEVAGSAENPLTLLIQEVQGRALKPVHIIPGEAEDA
ncbi:hypothetical protein [Sediminicoccus rosea]|uniref:Uncharacterized protein n=1 Tax=Sediminicoccus rosea TaxID=1225128 RepID=A0ABZ0PNL8_9PROT|nr:hypothetical protein [Sediminicoccus rosea]WPB86918.1 hypothetical protein R9Z33_08570 [Sediminicoccus rosea]